MSFYHVVQFGDLIRGEVLNIGIVVVDNGHVWSKWIENWDRIEDTFRKDPFIHSWIENFQRRVVTSELLDEEIGSTGPYSSLQFTSSRASIQDPESLLDDMFKIFIVESNTSGF